MCVYLFTSSELSTIDFALLRQYVRYIDKFLLIFTTTALFNNVVRSQRQEYQLKFVKPFGRVTLISDIWFHLLTFFNQAFINQRPAFVIQSDLLCRFWKTIKTVSKHKIGILIS